MAYNAIRFYFPTIENTDFPHITPPSSSALPFTSGSTFFLSLTRKPASKI